MMQGLRTVMFGLIMLCAVVTGMAQFTRPDRSRDTLAEVLRASRAMKIGGSAYWAYGTHDASFKTLPPFTNCCDEYGSTTGNTYGIGVRVRDIAPSLPIPLSVHAGYRYSQAPFQTTTTERMFDGTPTTVNALIEHALDITWHDVTFGIAADVELYHPLWLTAGIEGAFTAGATYDQSERLVSPTTMVFETGTDVRNLSSGVLSGYNPINALADVGLRVRLLNFDVTNKDPLGTWVDLRARYLWQLTPTYQDASADNNVGRSYRKHLITLGLEVYF